MYVEIYIFLKKEAFDLRGRRQQEQQLGSQHRHQHQLTHEKPEDCCQENNSNLTDCSTVHGIPSSHCANTHTHTRLRADTHCVLNTDSSSLAAKKSSTSPIPPPINKHSHQIDSTQSHSLRLSVCVRVCV